MVDTSNQLAVIFTKPLQLPQFLACSDGTMVEVTLVFCVIRFRPFLPIFTAHSVPKGLEDMNQMNPRSGPS